MTMRAKTLLWIFFFLLGPFTSVWAENFISLKECYELALKRSESYAITQEDINIAQARFSQALGAILPKVSFRFTEFLEDTPQSLTSNSSLSSLNQGSRPSFALNVKQPLFQGLKEYHAFKLNELDKQRLGYKLQDLKRLLFRDVAVAYYTVVKTALDIQTHERLIPILEKRIAELKQRVSLGKARKTELLAQESELSLLKAELEKSKGDKAVAYELLSFFTGLSPHPAVIIRSPGKTVKPLAYYLEKAQIRPDIQISKKEIEMAERQVKIHQGDLLPKLDAEFNLYPYRSGFQRDVIWDASIQLNIPVFEFSRFGEIKEAKLKVKQSQLQSHEIQKNAASEVKKAYEAFLASSRQLTLYEQTIQKTKESYEAELNDYHASLVTNLEVLQAQRNFLDSLRLYQSVRAQQWLNWINLALAAGDFL